MITDHEQPLSNKSTTTDIKKKIPWPSLFLVYSTPSTYTQFSTSSGSGFSRAIIKQNDYIFCALHGVQIHATEEGKFRRGQRNPVWSYNRFSPLHERCLLLMTIWRFDTKTWNIITTFVCFSWAAFHMQNHLEQMKVRKILIFR